MATLLNRSKLQSYHQISDAISDDKLNQIIEEAELEDLKPLLTRELFMLVKADPSSYVDILEPKSGSIDNVLYDHSGLEKVLSYFVYGRLVMFGDAISTPFGFHRKNSSTSEPLSIQDRRAIYNNQRQIANSLWIEVRNYIILSDLDGYNQRHIRTVRGSGFNIKKIS